MKAFIRGFIEKYNISYKVCMKFMGLTFNVYTNSYTRRLFEINLVSNVKNVSTPPLIVPLQLKLFRLNV